MLLDFVDKFGMVVFDQVLLFFLLQIHKLGVVFLVKPSIVLGSIEEFLVLSLLPLFLVLIIAFLQDLRCHLFSLHKDMCT